MPFGKDALLIGAQHGDYATLATAGGTYFPGIGWKAPASTDDVNTADDAIFAITGKVAVSLLIGEVTTQIGATCTSMSVNGAADNIVIATSLDIDGDAAGVLYWAEGDGTILASSTTLAEVGNAVGSATLFIMNGINLDRRCDATMTAGRILWECFYIPLENAGTIATA